MSATTDYHHSCVLVGDNDTFSEPVEKGVYTHSFPVYQGYICIGPKDCEYLYGVRSLPNLPDHINGQMVIRFSQTRFTTGQEAREDLVNSHTNNLAVYNEFRNQIS